jgi:hypothetical protein
MTRIRHTFTGLLAIAAGSLAATAVNAGAIPARAPACRGCHASAGQHAAEKAVAAATTTAQANAMQAAAVARGEANSVLANPYIEQKVTIPESVGFNRTKIPAGGF